MKGKGSPSKSGQGEGGELTESQQSTDSNNNNSNNSNRHNEIPEKPIEGPCEVHVFVLEVDFDFDALAAVADGRLSMVPSLQHGAIGRARVAEGGGVRVVGVVAVPVQTVNEVVGISMSARGEYLTICSGTGTGTVGAGVGVGTGVWWCVGNDIRRVVSGE